MVFLGLIQHTKISSLMFIVPGMPSSASLIMFWNTLAADVTAKLRPTSSAHRRAPTLAAKRPWLLLVTWLTDSGS